MGCVSVKFVGMFLFSFLSVLSCCCAVRFFRLITHRLQTTKCASKCASCNVILLTEVMYSCEYKWLGQVTWISKVTMIALELIIIIIIISFITPSHTEKAQCIKHLQLSLIHI